MTHSPAKLCCGTSVGVLIEQDGRYLMFERAKFPPGIAPVAGHALDEHASFEEAAVAEVREEVGLEVVSLTLLMEGEMDNRCRRQGVDDYPGHEWKIYRADVQGELNPSADETRNVRWVDGAELQVLADITIAYSNGHLTDAEFAQQPGIEAVWVQWLAGLGLINVDPADMLAIYHLAARGPAS